MAHISIDEAAVRSGIPRQTLETWVERGLLTVYARPASDGTAGQTERESTSELVDEDQLEQVVESVGWLHLSEQGWDGAEEH